MIRFLTGDARDCLRAVPANSVHTIVTSPPYWACRNYGGDTPRPWADGQSIPLGLEPNPKDYIRHLLEILNECRRVLHPSGLLFLNLGDTWCGKRNIRYDADIDRGYYADTGFKSYSDVQYPKEWGLKPRDLTGVPHRTAFAMQMKGWHLRSFFPWIKRNAPPVATDLKRPSNALEYCFMFAKSMPHYWDKDAVLVKSEGWPGGRVYRDTDWYIQSLRGMVFDGDDSDEDGFMGPLGLVLPTASGGSEHLARYPSSLVEPCIKLGSSERGCCPTCLYPYRRLVEKLREPYPWRKTIGWEPVCGCPPSAPIPCTVLDPFSGTGTTQETAIILGRSAIYIDQSEDYTAKAKARLESAHGLVEAAKEFEQPQVAVPTPNLVSAFWNRRAKAKGVDQTIP